MYFMSGGMPLMEMYIPMATISAWGEYEPDKKQETKKERIQRIALAKMYASWDVYNKKKQDVIQIKQLYKPRHKLYYFGGKKFKSR